MEQLFDKLDIFSRVFHVATQDEINLRKVRRKESQQKREEEKSHISYIFFPLEESISDTITCVNLMIPSRFGMGTRGVAFVRFVTLAFDTLGNGRFALQNKTFSMTYFLAKKSLQNRKHAIEKR